MVCGCEEKLKAEITAEDCWEGTGGGANVPRRQWKRMQSMYQQIIKNVNLPSTNCHAVIFALNLLVSRRSLKSNLAQPILGGYLGRGLLKH